MHYTPCTVLPALQDELSAVHILCSCRNCTMALQTLHMPVSLFAPVLLALCMLPLSTPAVMLSLDTMAQRVHYVLDCHYGWSTQITVSSIRQCTRVCP